MHCKGQAYLWNSYTILIHPSQIPHCKSAHLSVSCRLIISSRLLQAGRLILLGRNTESVVIVVAHFNKCIDVALSRSSDPLSQRKARSVIRGGDRGKPCQSQNCLVCDGLSEQLDQHTVRRKLHTLVEDIPKIVLGYLKPFLGSHPPLEHCNFFALIGTRHPGNFSIAKKVVFPNASLCHELVERHGHGARAGCHMGR